MKQIVITSIFSLFLLISVALASGIDITVPDSIIAVYINQHNTINVTVRNTQNIADSLIISVWPTQWISVSQYGISLDPNETRTVTLLIDPPRQMDRGIYQIDVIAKSASTSASDKKTLLIELKRDLELFISSLKLNSQVFNLGDDLGSNIIVTNLNTKSERTIILTTEIVKNDLVIEKFDDEVTISPNSAETIVNNIRIKNTLEYGSYKLKVELKDLSGKVLDEKELAFNVKRSEDFSKDKKTEFGLFYLTTSIIVTNKGNVPDAKYTLTESIPLHFKNFFFPDIEPTAQQEVDGRIVYTWELTSLKPGETRTTLYQIRFTNVVVAILLIGLGLYIFNYFYFRPNIMKRHPRIISQPQEEMIHLHVKNRSRREIKNVTVKDYVPPLARVIKKFDTIEPQIKLTTKGTVLKWKIDKLSPSEEIVLSYKIVPVMEIPGGLKLPSAHFTYEGGRHIIDSVANKIVEKIR